MIVLGIDPGYALMGWGVVEAQGARMRLLGYGCVETQAGVPMQHRLRALQLGVRDLVNIYHPDDVAFEELFFARNVTTALMVGAARGAAIISAAEYTESLYEYTPMQIKQAVTGYGKADKKQIQQMVKLLLGMKEIPKPDDAADAIACARSVPEPRYASLPRDGLHGIPQWCPIDRIRGSGRATSGRSSRIRNRGIARTSLPYRRQYGGFGTRRSRVAYSLHRHCAENRFGNWIP